MEQIIIKQNNILRILGMEKNPEIGYHYSTLYLLNAAGIPRVWVFIIKNTSDFLEKYICNNINTICNLWQHTREAMWFTRNFMYIHERRGKKELNNYVDISTHTLIYIYAHLHIYIYTSNITHWLMWSLTLATTHETQYTHWTPSKNICKF